MTGFQFLFFFAFSVRRAERIGELWMNCSQGCIQICPGHMFHQPEAASCWRVVGALIDSRLTRTSQFSRILSTRAMKTTVDPQTNQFSWTMSVIPLIHCHQLSAGLTIWTSRIWILIRTQYLILFATLKSNLIIVIILSLALSAGWLACESKSRLFLQARFGSSLFGGSSEARLWKMAASICTS